MRIDAHQHFWHYDLDDYDWIDESMNVLKEDFLPSQLESLLASNGFDGCVAVQARQSEAETAYLLEMGAQYSFIKGVVGWVDLCESNVAERLAHFSQYEKLCGIRHIIQAEQDDNFMLRDDFQNGVNQLGQFDLAYNILIFPKHLEPAFKLVQQFPNQRFVIDHLAKPHIKNQEINDWKKGMERIAQLPNVYCKVSGLVTEADWSGWKSEDFTPYLDAVFSSFGTDRMMIGSDWPVCLLGGGYSEVIGIVADYISTYSDDEIEKVMGLNAAKFYQLN